MSERGVAMPTALIALAVLLALMLALSLLGGTEPVIAANHATGARARALAESGVEHALWALSHATVAGGIAEPMPSSPAPAPYDGARTSFRAVEVAGGASQGGFVVTVANAASGRTNERDITAVGYVPDATSPTAARRIVATATKIKRLDPPCALCVAGTAQVGDTATVNGSNAAGSPPAAYCAGQVPASTILAAGAVSTTGGPDIVAPPGGAAIADGVGAASFEAFTLTDADLAVLESLARANGTYYQGGQTFTSPPPDGIVFVDTPSGRPLGPSSPPGDVVEVDVRGPWPAGWRGWLVVAGNVRLNGQIDMTGLVYAQRDLSSDNRGRIRGAVIAGHQLDAGGPGGGEGAVTYDCPAVRSGGGAVPQHWFVKPGSYRELAAP